MEGKEQIIKILNEFKFDIPLEVGSATIINADDFPAIAEKLSQLDGWHVCHCGSPLSLNYDYHGDIYYECDNGHETRNEETKYVGSQIETEIENASYRE